MLEFTDKRHADEWQNKMNEYLLMTLIERLLALYAENGIVVRGSQNTDGYTEAFTSLVGDMQDAVSKFE